jgi:hypothetical protein
MFLSSSALAGLLLGAATPAAPAPQATPAQRAEVKALTEKLGACHRARAVAGAATKATADQIVKAAMAACETRVLPIRQAMAKVMGAEQADALLAAYRPRWQDAIRRNVAAERARRGSAAR